MIIHTLPLSFGPVTCSLGNSYNTWTLQQFTYILHLYAAWAILNVLMDTNGLAQKCCSKAATQGTGHSTERREKAGAIQLSLTVCGNSAPGSLFNALLRLLEGRQVRLVTVKRLISWVCSLACFFLWRRGTRQSNFGARGSPIQFRMHLTWHDITCLHENIYPGLGECCKRNFILYKSHFQQTRFF